MIVRALWFVFVGWWATGIWLTVAWVLNILVVTIPLGIKMINMVPMVLSLKSRQQQVGVVGDDGEIVMEGAEQRSLVVRGVWFVFVGWWASAIWMFVAYIFTLSIIGLPLAIWMYGKLPAVVSLYNY